MSWLDKLRRKPDQPELEHALNKTEVRRINEEFRTSIARGLESGAGLVPGTLERAYHEKLEAERRLEWHRAVNLMGKQADEVMCQDCGEAVEDVMVQEHVFSCRRGSFIEENKLIEQAMRAYGKDLADMMSFGVDQEELLRRIYDEREPER